MIRKDIQIGDCRLILGDCLEVLPLLGNVDAVVTDPPYGIGQDRGVNDGGKRLAVVRRYVGAWDAERPSQAVFDLMLGSASRHIIWGGNYFSDLLPMSGKWLWWDKLQTMPTYSDGELAWTSLDGTSTKKFTYNGSGMSARELDRQHPTQKPVELMKWCLGFLPDARTILDPYMGSGSTGVACARTGRSFIGIELDEGYFNIACERIRRAYGQLDLFIDYRAPRAPEAVQQAFLLEAAE